MIKLNKLLILTPIIASSALVVVSCGTGEKTTIKYSMEIETQGELVVDKQVTFVAKIKNENVNLDNIWYSWEIEGESDEKIETTNTLKHTFNTKGTKKIIVKAYEKQLSNDGWDPMVGKTEISIKIV